MDTNKEASNHERGYTETRGIGDSHQLSDELCRVYGQGIFVFADYTGRALFYNEDFWIETIREAAFPCGCASDRRNKRLHDHVSITGTFNIK